MNGHNCFCASGIKNRFYDKKQKQGSQLGEVPHNSYLDCFSFRQIAMTSRCDEIDDLVTNPEDISKYCSYISLYNEGRYDEAVQGFTEIYDTRVHLLGANHKETLDAKYWMSHALYVHGNYDKAVEGFTEIYNARVDALGANHEDTLDAKYCMNVPVYEEDNYEDSIGFLEDSEADEHDRYQSTLNTQNWDHSNFNEQDEEAQFSTIVFDTELILFSYKEDCLNSKYWQNSSSLKQISSRILTSNLLMCKLL